jgi:hypothetical protein
LRADLFSGIGVDEHEHEHEHVEAELVDVAGHAPTSHSNNFKCSSSPTM